MTRLALFDCDGTLVDSQHSICAAMDACFGEAGLPAPLPGAVRRVVGLSLVEAVARLHPVGGADAHHDLAEGYKRAFQRMRGEAAVREPLYEGMADAIERIAAAGWLLGVATGKSARGLTLCLEQHGLLPRFVTLQTADRHPSKPHPAMARAALAEAGVERGVMIGDTSFDIAMGKAAGLGAIGVAWGYHDPADLLAAGADRIAETPAALPGLLEELA